MQEQLFCGYTNMAEIRLMLDCLNEIMGMQQFWKRTATLVNEVPASSGTYQLLYFLWLLGPSQSSVLPCSFRPSHAHSRNSTLFSLEFNVLAVFWWKQTILKTQLLGRIYGLCSAWKVSSNYMGEYPFSYLYLPTSKSYRGSNETSFGKSFQPLSGLVFSNVFNF